MDERYIQKRIREILEGRIAMGGGAIAGVTDNWLNFVKCVRELAETEGVEISQKDAMQLASPIWKDIRERKPSELELVSVPKAAVEPYDIEAPHKSGALRSSEKAEHHGHHGHDMLEGPADPILVEYIEEILGEGFELGDILRAIKDVAEVLVPIAKDVVPLIRSFLPGAPPPPPPPKAKPAKEKAEHIDDEDADYEWVRRKKPKSRAKPEGMGGAAKRRDGKGRFMTKAKRAAGVRAGVKAGARAGVKAGARAGVKAGARKKAKGGAAAYHAALRAYKDEHPRMSHAQAVKSFSPKWQKMKA